MNNLWTMLLLGAAGACVLLQVTAALRIILQRRRLGKMPRLESQPLVKRWMRVSRGAALGAIVSSFGASRLHEDLLPFVIVTGASVILLIAAASIADNSSEPGDGDSGG